MKDLTPLRQLLNNKSWILHAATQDLPCLFELELKPGEIFDTELAARLLSLPHVGLGGLLEDELQITLDKEHSAADWSKRPLPQDWLVYAPIGHMVWGGGYLSKMGVLDFSATIL